MSFFLTSIVSTLIVLGIMVLVHEFGHFAVAKMCGVRVEVFSIGFGKRLFGITRGGTDYRLSLLPLGGYVKMAGELGGDGMMPEASPSTTEEGLTGHSQFLTDGRDPGDLAADPDCSCWAGFEFHSRSCPHDRLLHDAQRSRTFPDAAWRC